jgi:hypothetical protein
MQRYRVVLASYPEDVEMALRREENSEAGNCLAPALFVPRSRDK